jgi:hypothetical protein
MIRDAAHHDRGMAAFKAADVACTLFISEQADVAMRGVLIFRLAALANAAKRCFDGRDPTCMRSRGVGIYNNRDAAKIAKQQYVRDAKAAD